MKYKNFKLSEKQVKCIRTMMIKSNPDNRFPNDTLSIRKSLIKKFEGFATGY